MALMSGKMLCNPVIQGAFAFADVAGCSHRRDLDVVLAEDAAQLVQTMRIDLKFGVFCRFCLALNWANKLQRSEARFWPVLQAL